MENTITLSQKASICIDISLSAYEEGYLSADAFYCSRTLTQCPENPYPPGPWRPFRSWRMGWDDYHAERKGE